MYRLGSTSYETDSNGVTAHPHVKTVDYHVTEALYKYVNNQHACTCILSQLFIVVRCQIIQTIVMLQFLVVRIPPVHALH